MTEVKQSYPEPSHFQGKDALGHVAEAQAMGKISAAEIHGTEVPGFFSAATDAARESALFFLLVWVILSKILVPEHEILNLLGVLAIGWMIWKTGRSAWLGWFRLERMHRVLGQEKWEIEHHRQQERDELRVLYAAKGFEGKLLEDVLDVLMADGDRLLRVMVEEELGLRLEAYDHPLKQCFGAAIGVLIAAVTCFAGLFLFSSYGMVASALGLVGIAGSVTAKYADNRMIPSFVWNLGIAVLSFGSVYFLFDYFLGK